MCVCHEGNNVLRQEERDGLTQSHIAFMVKRREGTGKYRFPIAPHLAIQSVVEVVNAWCWRPPSDEARCDEVHLAAQLGACGYLLL